MPEREYGMRSGGYDLKLGGYDMGAGGYDLKAEGFDTGAGGYDVRLPTDLTGKASFLSSIRLFCMRPAFTRLLRMHPASGHLPAQFFRIICITVLLLTALRVMPEGLTLAHAQEVKGSVTYGSFIGNGFKAPFYYSDDYFKGSTAAYSDSLSTMSMCLSLSAFAAKGTDYRNKAENLYSLLEQCGFDMGTFKVNDAFTQKPGPDTIGAGAAGKIITDENGKPCWLIACAIRGLGYETEWAGNFTMGEKDEHQGFQDAAHKVISFLQEYSESNPQISGNVKLWITGFSRAAAVTNLTAAMLDEGMQISSRFTLGTDTVYAYCFESPQGTLISLDPHNARYQNIFSIVNQGDFVPELAPTMPSAQYGFTHYGTVLYLPYASASNHHENKTNSVKKMLRYYDQLEGTKDYPPGAFQMKQLSIINILTGNGIEEDSTWTQPFFIKSMVASLAAMIGDRIIYTEKYQPVIREMIEIMFSGGASGNVMHSFSSHLKENSAELATATAASMLFGKENVLHILEKALTDALNECGVTGYSREDIHIVMDTLSDLLIQFGAAHPDYVATLAFNLKPIVTNHFPELCLAWLMSFDPNYGDGNHSGFVSGYYRLLRISGSESLTLHDASGNEISDMPEYAVYTDEDGTMWVELPLDEDCTFFLIPWENAACKVEVYEFSDQRGLVRVVRYLDVKLAEGKPWTLSVEAAEPEELQRAYELAGGTDSSCVLTDDAGNQMPPSEEMTGQDTHWAVFRIRSYTNDTQYGWTDGGGIGFLGDYEKVNAYPLDGCRFTGWYENGTLVSDEPSYQFPITGDVALEARFEPVSGG